MSNKADLGYIWKGKSKNGTIVKGRSTAATTNLVKAELRKQGIVPIKIRKYRPSLFTERKPKIKPQDIAIFSRQLATMIGAGIPLVQSFDIIAKGAENVSMREVVIAIKNDLESGSPLAESLAKHPKHFNELYCNLVATGEQSGSLETMLDKVAAYREKAESIKGKIKKALYYPITVVAVSFLITAGLMIFVIPKFAEMFSNFGAELPALTQKVMALSVFFQAYWYIIFGAIAAGIYGFKEGIVRSKKFAEMVDKTLLKTPVIGAILNQAAIARYARTLEITFAAGLPLVDALQSVAGATGNIVYTKAALRIRDEVGTGQQIQLAMKNAGLFPNIVIQMISIGEESGSLELMLGKIADMYEERVDNAVDALSSLIEPVVIVIIGSLVGTIIIAMYLPIFKMASVV